MCGGEEGRTRTSHSHHRKVALSHIRVVENIFTLIQLPLMMMMFDDM